MKWESPINTKGKHPPALTECHIFGLEYIYGNIPCSSPDMIFERQSSTVKIIGDLGNCTYWLYLYNHSGGLCTL